MFEKAKEFSIKHAFSSAVAFLVSLATVVTFLYYIDDRWAKAKDLAYVEMRLDQKILSDRLYDLQQRLWMLEDRYGEEKEMPEEVRTEYRKLKQEYESIKRQLERSYRKIEK